MHKFKIDKQNYVECKQRAGTFKAHKTKNPHYQSAQKIYKQPLQQQPCDSFVEQFFINLNSMRGAQSVLEFEEMPSVELNSVGSTILTPRDFDQFFLEVRELEQKIHKNEQKNHLKGPILTNTKKVSLQRRYKTQVVRTNATIANYHKLYSQLKSKGCKYTDDVFLANTSAFKGCNKQHKKIVEGCIWKRVESGEKLSQCYPVQGVYRTENLLSCFVALPQNLQMNLFQNQRFDDQISLIYVRLNKDGYWRYILLDNIFPYSSHNIALLSQGFAVSLLEKAWAKYLGSYSKLDSIEHVKLGQIITDLTGAPSNEISVNHPMFATLLKESIIQKYIVLVTANQNEFKMQRLEVELGLNAQYSYPIVKIEGEYAYLKNEWGNLRGVKKQEIIQIPIKELKEYFEFMVVNKIIQNGYYNSIPVRQKRGYYSLIRLVVTKSCKAYITLSQIDKQTNRQQYSKCRVILFEQKQSVIYCKDSESQQRKTNLEVEHMQAGSYLVLIQMNWINKEYQTVLSLLTTQQIQAQRLKYEQANDYLLTLKKGKTKSERKMKPVEVESRKSVRSARFV